MKRTTMKPHQGTVDNENLEGSCDLGNSPKQGCQKHDEGNQNHASLPVMQKIRTYSVPNSYNSYVGMTFCLFKKKKMYMSWVLVSWL